MAALIQGQILKAMELKNYDLLRALTQGNKIDLNASLPGAEIPPLVLATLLNEMEFVRILIENGADPNVRSEFAYKSNGRILYHAGYPPLFAAFHNLEIFEYLLRHGADVNAVDKMGNTVAHVCLRHAALLSSQHYKLLREFNFDFTAVNKDGVNLMVELLDSAVDKGLLEPDTFLSIIYTFAQFIPIDSDLSQLKVLPSTGNSALLTADSPYDTFYGLLWSVAVRGVSPITPEYRRLVLEGRDAEASEIFDPYRKVDMDENILIGVAKLGARLTDKEAIALAPAVVCRAPANLVRLFLHTGGCVPATIGSEFTPKYLKENGRQRIADILLEHMKANIARVSNPAPAAEGEESEMDEESMREFQKQQSMSESWESFGDDEENSEQLSGESSMLDNVGDLIEERLTKFAQLYDQKPDPVLIARMREIAQKNIEKSKDGAVLDMKIPIETNTNPALDHGEDSWVRDAKSAAWSERRKKIDPETDKKMNDVLHKLYQETEDPFVWMLMQGNSNKRTKMERDIENAFRIRAGLPPLPEDTSEPTLLGKLGPWEEEVAAEDVVNAAEKEAQRIEEEDEEWDEQKEKQYNDVEKEAMVFERMDAATASVMNKSNVVENPAMFDAYLDSKRLFSTYRPRLYTGMQSQMPRMLGMGSGNSWRYGFASSLAKKVIRLLK